MQAEKIRIEDIDNRSFPQTYIYMKLDFLVLPELRLVLAVYLTALILVLFLLGLKDVPSRSLVKIVLFTWYFLQLLNYLLRF